ncbi:hypothetical protein, partial [Pseudomonas sp. 51_B]|uniref:hypothetical protein n=1 Tax=Pseudomonas sp. 51_B TaxID=2813573 RepID=UPI001A9FCD2B
LSAHFDETTLQRILDISATEQSTLRRVLAQNLRLPALLEDTLDELAVKGQGWLKTLVGLGEQCRQGWVAWRLTHALVELEA